MLIDKQANMELLNQPYHKGNIMQKLLAEYYDTINNLYYSRNEQNKKLAMDIMSRSAILTDSQIKENLKYYLTSKVVLKTNVASYQNPIFATPTNVVILINGTYLVELYNYKKDGNLKRLKDIATYGYQFRYKGLVYELPKESIEVMKLLYGIMNRKTNLVNMVS